MKKYLFMLVAVFAMSTAAFAQKGVTGFGVQGAYDDLNGQFGIGVKLQLGLVDQLRGDVATDLFFKKKDISIVDVNANLHYVFPVASGFNVYPLAGLNLAFFNLCPITVKSKATSINSFFNFIAFVGLVLQKLLYII